MSWILGKTIGDYFQTFWSGIVDNSGMILWRLLGVAVIFLAGKLALNLVSRLTAMQMKKSESLPEIQARRVQTMMTMLRSVFRYVVYFICALMILAQLGYGNAINNLLLSAGIGSLAIGIGAQSLIKDVATGFFMMFEKQYSVGDFVKLDDIEGTVTATAMRVTYLKNYTGQQIIIPNGSISRVINYSRMDSLAKVVISTPYEADTRSVMEIIRQAAEAYAATQPEVIVEPPQVLGISELAESAVNITVICKTKPCQHWAVERGLRLAVKERLEEEGLSIPYPQQDVHVSLSREPGTIRTAVLPEAAERIEETSDQ